MSLSNIAERIANTTSVWSGPEEVGGALVWTARVPFEGVRAEAGTMRLTDESLMLTDNGNFEMGHPDGTVRDNFDMTEVFFHRREWMNGIPLPLSVTFHRNDQIESTGRATRLMLHWLAHGLLD